MKCRLLCIVCALLLIPFHIHAQDQSSHNSTFGPITFSKTVTADKPMVDNQPALYARLEMNLDGNLKNNIKKSSALGVFLKPFFKSTKKRNVSGIIKVIYDGSTIYAAPVFSGDVEKKASGLRWGKIDVSDSFVITPYIPLTTGNVITIRFEYALSEDVAVESSELVKIASQNISGYGSLQSMISNYLNSTTLPFFTGIAKNAERTLTEKIGTSSSVDIQTSIKFGPEDEVTKLKFLIAGIDGSNADVGITINPEFSALLFAKKEINNNGKTSYSPPDNETSWSSNIILNKKSFGKNSAVDLLTSGAGGVGVLIDLWEDLSDQQMEKICTNFEAATSGPPLNLKAEDASIVYAALLDRQKREELITNSNCFSNKLRSFIQDNQINFDFISNVLNEDTLITVPYYAVSSVKEFAKAGTWKDIYGTDKKEEFFEHIFPSNQLKVNGAGLLFFDNNEQWKKTIVEQSNSPFLGLRLKGVTIFEKDQETSIRFFIRELIKISAKNQGCFTYVNSNYKSRHVIRLADETGTVRDLLIDLNFPRKLPRAETGAPKINEMTIKKMDSATWEEHSKFFNPEDRCTEDEWNLRVSET